MPAEVIAQTGPGAVTPTPAKAAPVVAAPPPAPTAPTKSPEVLAVEAKAEAARLAQEIAIARAKRKYETDLKKEREGLGPKLARLAEFEKSEAAAKLDPAGYLEKKYGKDWYEIVINAKLNNGAPTADAVSLKLAEMEEKIESKLKERDEQQTKAQAEAEREMVAQSRREQVALAGEFWAAAEKDYPSVSGLGTAAEIGAELARRREQYYDATSKRDESGRLVSPGQVLPLPKVAEMWEGQIVALAERVARHEKYAGKFAVAPSAGAPSVGQQQRRTLSNDLTGSTPQRSAPANDIERRARAIAAYEAKSKPIT